MADDVEIRFGATLESFNLGMAQIRETLQGLTEPLRGVRDNLGEVAEAFIAAFAVEKIADFVKEMAELGEQAVRTSEMLGMTTEQVTDLQFAAAVTGGSAHGMTVALERLSRSMANAQNAASMEHAAFQALGISADFLKEHQNDLMGVLEAVAQKFSESADGPGKTAIAMDLLGRSGAEMIPLLNEGAAGFEELKAKAQASGNELSGPVAEGMAKTAENNNLLGRAMQGLGETLFQVFEPAINSILTSMTQWAESITGNLRRNTILTQAVEALALSVDVVIGVIEALVGIFEELWTVGELVIQGLEKGLIGLASAVGDAVTGNWGKVGSDLNNLWSDQVSNYEAHAKSMEDIAKDTALNIGKMFDAQMGINDDQKANASGSPDDRDKTPLVAPPSSPGTGAHDALDAARIRADGEIQIMQRKEATKQTLLSRELQAHQISTAEWVAQSEAAADAEYNAEKAVLEKEQKLAGLTLTQKQELTNKIKLLEQKNADDIAKIHERAAAEDMKRWTGVMDAIASAVNSQVSSVLKGTETIGQAVEQIGLSLVTTMVENAIKSIAASAAQTFGGIFAFLAPTMGPAAAVPAAAGQASVMAVAGGLASFEVGTWGLPADSPVMAHKGEMIAPAFESGKIRAMADAFASGQMGGGGDVHNHTWNVNALDARSFVQMLRDNSSPLSQIVSQTFNAQTTLRPSY